MSTAVETAVDGAAGSRRRVRVWLAEHAFIDYPAADASNAAWFEAAMRNQFRSCKVTNDPDPDPADNPAASAVT